MDLGHREVEEGGEVFPHDVEVAFNSAYDKLLRAFDGLELSRDLLASVRDYHQSKIANGGRPPGVLRTVRSVSCVITRPISW